MATTTKQKHSRSFVIDDQGRPTAVIMSISDYEELLEAAEQQADIKHLEKAKHAKGKAVGWQEVKKQLQAAGKLEK
jgi:PHD/YefM family antitoxin component YafN of YafNO toxin-antitoxin module